MRGSSARVSMVTLVKTPGKGMDVQPVARVTAESRQFSRARQPASIQHHGGSAAWQWMRSASLRYVRSIVASQPGAPSS
jgi:hypothetical protein